MGVRGLESFIRENRTSMTKTISLPTIDDSTSSSLTDSSNDDGRIPIIVDAWGVIFKLYLDTLPWTSGGEYLRYYKLIKRLVNAWRSVRLEPTFVFDGAAPPEKHQTILSRASEKLLSCQLFYTTSIPSRSSPSFSKNKVVLPFFASHTFTYALHRLGVKTHFVPTGEADGVCVSMAEKVGGYVFGRDSDFVILMGRTERVRGYVPIDMLNWIEGPSNNNTDQPPGARANGSEQDSFRPVHNGRRNMNGPTSNFMNKQSSLIPSSTLKNPTLVITYIPSQALRHRLRIPSTHLPLFASLCGTDYIPPSIAVQLYENHLTSFQKIEKAARILREQLYSPSNNATSNGKRKSDNPGDQVVELVRRVIKKLCVYPFDTQQSLDETVDLIIEAALQYSLPSNVDDCCATYPFCGELDLTLGCQTPISLGVEAEDEPDSLKKEEREVSGKEEYSKAQKMGLVGTITHGWLYPDRMYQWQVLEDLSGPCLKASDGAKGIRRKAWMIADEGLGGLRFSRNEVVDDKMDLDNVGTQAQEEKELRDLLGVPSSETYSEIEGVASDDTTLVEQVAPTFTRPIREMTEYLRQGSTAKIIASPLTLPPVQPLFPGELPICLKPIEERLKIYLESLHSNTEGIRSLPVSLQPLVSLVRFCVIDASRRSTGKTDHNKWRREEVVAVLRAMIGTYTLWKRELHSEELPKDKAKGEGRNEEEGGRLYPMLETRSANLIAQLGSVWSDVQLLAQALLLLPESINPTSNRSHHPASPEDNGSEIGTTHLIPFIFFSGVTLHSLLAKIEPTQNYWKWTEEEERVFESCWNALIDGLEEYGEFIVGLNNPHHKIVSAEIKPQSMNGNFRQEEIEGDGRAKKHKRKKRTKSPLGVNANVGRFGVLEGMLE
ncbi:hypothetical protein L486_03139 [Kwoniella mangroviensis CBS 10435]|uniref:Asteroid domain-containing protein n=1 Tax=Kwoniella mangroviensis CBS 10435 TaxID=1331196 RepID=A0A1B9ISY4_9TREE|nr:hypothetical protein L486_03139 [Kwoniella mangroviensis CBS 10435]